MSTEVGVGYVSIVPSAKGFSAALRSQVGDIGAPLGAKIGADAAGGVERSLSERLAAAGPRLTKVGGSLTKYVTLPLVGLATAAGLVGMRTAAGLEQAEIGFTTMLGSGQKARDFLSELKDFAAKTPFELPGLVANARQLLGVGVAANQVLPTLQSWGDAAGALGLSQDQYNRAMLAYTQMISKGKVSAEEMMQLTEAGIPAYQLLAKATGLPVAELQRLQQSGDLLSQDTLPKLLSQMNADYGGSMAAQSQTLTGLWSTFKDTLSIGLADSLQTSMPQIKDALAQLTAALGPALQAAGPAIADLLKAVVPLAEKFAGLLKAWTDAGPGVQGFTVKLAALGAAAGPVLVAAGKLAPGIGMVAKASAAGAGGVANLARGFGSASQAASSATGVMGTFGGGVRAALGHVVSGATGAMGALGGFLRQLPANARAIGSVAAAVAQTAAQYAKLAVQAGLATVKLIAQNVATVAIRAATTAWTAVQWLLNAALSANPIGLVIIAIVALIAGIVLLWNNCEWFRNAVTAAWEAIQAAVGAVVGWFQQYVLPALSAAWEWIKAGVGVLWRAFSAYWGFIWNIVSKVIEWIVQNVWPKIQAAWEAVKAGLTVLWQVFQTQWNAIKTVVQVVVDWVKEHIIARFNAIKQTAEIVWNAVSGAVSTAIEAVKSVINTVKGKIDTLIGWFDDIKKRIGGALKGVADGISGPFKSAFNAVASAWNNTVGKLSWTVPDWVPGFGGKTISAPNLPTLADGATIEPRAGGTLAILAEAGRPESVVDTGLLNRRLADLEFARESLAAPRIPSHLVVIDADGALIGRMELAADQALGRLADDLVYRTAV